jgi:hypothetical protein
MLDKRISDCDEKGRYSEGARSSDWRGNRDQPLPCELKASKPTLPHNKAMASNTSSYSSWSRNRAEVLRGIRAGVKSGNFESCSRRSSIHVVRACAKLWRDRPSVLELRTGAVSFDDSSILNGEHTGDVGHSQICPVGVVDCLSPGSVLCS